MKKPTKKEREEFGKLMEECKKLTESPESEKRALEMVRKINTLRNGHKKMTI